MAIRQQGAEVDAQFPIARHLHVAPGLGFYWTAFSGAATAFLANATATCMHRNAGRGSYTEGLEERPHRGWRDESQQGSAALNTDQYDAGIHGP
jgi:hypothetical protein